MDILTDFESSQKILIVLIICIALMLMKAIKGLVKAVVIPLILIGLAIWYFSK